MRRAIQANYVLSEIPEGLCSMHARNKIGGSKAIRTRVLWPNNTCGCRKIDKECQDCRGLPSHEKKTRQQKMTPIFISWSFYKWGIDIAGPFPKGPGKVKFLIVAIDYFTKWIEAKPVAIITGIIHPKIGVKSYAFHNASPRQTSQDNGYVIEENEAWEKG
ncbi:reverse transcriptase domain-containing protein [Tanacetum coccineum]